MVQLTDFITLDRNKCEKYLDKALDFRLGKKKCDFDKNVTLTWTCNVASEEIICCGAVITFII